MEQGRVYLHGQILGTHSFYLKDTFPKPDEYSELSKVYFLPGGETGTAATVLAALGVDVKIDGTHIGTQVAPMLRTFYENKSVDLSSLYFDQEYEGLMDYVIVAGLVRSPMGFFNTLYNSNEIRWNRPKEKDIEECSVAAVDPYFMDATQETAELCVKHGKPYVTIDCAHDTYLHRNCAVNVVSKECLEADYIGWKKEDVYKVLTEHTDGLVIITAGENDIIYGRKGQKPHYQKPFSVEVRSTLGAGDTFKAGCVYGLLKHYSDDELVRFAAACSAIAISDYPLPLKPPTLQKVQHLLESEPACR